MDYFREQSQGADIRQIVNCGEVVVTSGLIFLPRCCLMGSNSASRASPSISPDPSSLCGGHSEEWRVLLSSEQSCLVCLTVQREVRHRRGKSDFLGLVFTWRSQPAALHPQPAIVHGQRPGSVWGRGRLHCSGIQAAGPHWCPGYGPAAGGE